MVKWLVISLLLAFPFGKCFAASFDCAKASSVSEKLICASSELSELDERYAKLYKQVRAEAADAALVKKEAVAAFQKRESRCVDAACLTQWYRNRIAKMVSELHMPTACLGSQNHTQIDINNCAAKKVHVAKTVMNEYYLKVIQITTGNIEMRKLVLSSQEHWRSHSEAHCNAYEIIWSAGGSMGPFMYQRCLLDLVNKRTKSLWQTFLVEPGSGESFLPEPFPLFTVR